MTTRLFHIESERNRNYIVEAVKAAPIGSVVRVGESTRSLEQNAKLHALLDEVAAKQLWVGRKLTATQWKTLMISGHAVATGLGADLVPGLEGEFVSIRESSAQMSVSRMSSLIEYVMAWQAQNEPVAA